MDTLLFAFTTIIFTVFIFASIISIKEREYLAFKRFLILSFILPLPFLITALLNFSNKNDIGILLLAVTIVFIIVFFIPLGKKRYYKQAIPLKNIDERDTMFSRNEIKPGSELFEDYYERNPQNKKLDDNFRELPGLLNSEATQFNPFHFSASDASFETIKSLRNEVDGSISEKKININQVDVSSFIKSWSKKLGALDCGIADLKKYHLYSVGGRAERYGKKVVNNHKFAVAFTVEMDKTMLSSAPSGSIVMESGQQYLESGKIAIQIARFIRNLGYEARAHIDGNYQVVCPLVARDAGLGEIGRMGLLMTPKYGPRVRISVVTTNVPLLTDKPLNEYSTIDFCIKCKKCADSCPSQAIFFNDMEEIDGVKRWKINQEKCFTLWCSLGTDCGRCVSVCPYSHPNNLLHNTVRFGIKNSALFRILAIKLDDFFYGRKPHPLKLPQWLQIKAN